jgi:hypothetical protein
MNQTLTELPLLLVDADILFQLAASLDSLMLCCVFLFFLSMFYHCTHNRRFGDVDEEIINLHLKVKELIALQTKKVDKPEIHKRKYDTETHDEECECRKRHKIVDLAKG